jgi:octanoyl-[GcvH]:protein N-octanoyltransferase
VTISAWDEMGTVNRWLTHEVVARDLFARLPVITDADAWVAFSGGVGTLQEVALCRPPDPPSTARPGVTERRMVRLVREGFPEPPEMDTAVSHATLRLVAGGRLPETLRIHRPGRLVAFGPRDRVAPGFKGAAEAAARQGFGTVERLAGGRAAVFHEGTIALSWAVPDPRAREGIRPRFEALAEIVVEALRALGVDARIGEVPGEYCPGEHSVNARGRTKLMGVGQRIVYGAAHVGGVMVVAGADPIREVLVPVYSALDIEWDPATVGSVVEEAPREGWDAVVKALVDSFARRHDLEEDRLGAETLELARDLIPRHAIGP